jgi:signal transduction histidine kinase
MILVLLSLVYVAVGDDPLFTETVEILLPLVLAGGMIAFGWWVRGRPETYDDRQRLYTALGQVVGGVCLALITRWVLLVDGVEIGAVSDMAYIVLNGAAIGALPGGVLTALIIRLRSRRAALEARADQLQRQNSQLEKLASIVSHDLRNPLTVAQGRAELARESGDTDHFEAVERSLDRMEEIISDMLVLTRQAEDARDTTQVALDAAACSAWQTVETENTAVELEIEGSGQFEADEGRLRQLFENLFRNAIEHGEPAVTTVRVGRVDAGGFFIEDDGTGIPDRTRDELFEWGTTTEERGTGLGLAIADEVAMAHGWEIRVTESDDGGARFEVTGVESMW